MPGCGAPARLRKQSMAGGPLPLRQELSGLWPQRMDWVPLPRETHLSRALWCADTCRRPMEAPLTCLPCGLLLEPAQTLLSLLTLHGGCPQHLMAFGVCFVCLHLWSLLGHPFLALVQASHSLTGLPPGASRGSGGSGHEMPTGCHLPRALMGSHFLLLGCII